MSNLNGLSLKEVKERLVHFGLNTIPVPKYRLLKLIFRQIRGLFNMLLLAAAIITFALNETIDGMFILFFVLIGTTLNVFQEHKSNMAAEKLRTFLIRTITVRRDGEEQEVPNDQIVPGDILKLESGDIVPADAIVREERNLLVDETTFTGESIPVAKIAASSEIKDVSDENRLLQGAVIVRGNVLAEVTDTGLNTQLAKIAENASAVHSDSEIVKEVDRISKFILKVTFITLLFVVLANILIKGKNTDILNLFIFAIALAVTVIPEALPLVLTFSLSRGALQFAKSDVIVKRLSSVQDLGSVNLLCTDKTGTITENRLVHKNDYMVSDSKFHPLVLARLAAVNLKGRIPEPFDRAIDECLSFEQRNDVDDFILIEEEAFDPALRSNGAVVRRKDNLQLHIRRGSPEYFFDEELLSKEQVSPWITNEELQGHRVLGVSYDEGTGAKFGGFVSFADTIKATTAETIMKAEQLNVSITIITGDSLIVASAVAREIGLIKSDDEVMDATAFLALPVHKQKTIISKIRVFARATPEKKLILIEMLKETYTVGYLGDGINDAPALKSANVSMVVQSASDVARETADIILLNKDLRVIVNGICLGRETHANIMKYIRITLVSNFGNFYAIAIGSLLIDFLPMLPKQLLLLNLISDFPMMIIAFDNVSKLEVAQPLHYNFHSLYTIFITLGLVSTVFDFIYFGLFYKISPEVLQTNWFIASVITEILAMLSIRSMFPIEKAGRPAPLIIFLSSMAFIITIAVTMIPQTASFFEFEPPKPVHLFTIVSLSLLYLVVTELVKRPLAYFLKKETK